MFIYTQISLGLANTLINGTYILACFLISSAEGEKKAFFWYLAILSHLPWFSFTSVSLISGT